MIDQLIYTPEGLFTYYVTSGEISSNALKASGSVASEQDSGASPNRTYHLGSSPNRPSDSDLSDGASVVRASGLGPPTDEPLKKPRKYHDTIRFFSNTKERIFEICAPLYTQGLSLREIERQTGFVKITIKKTLNAGGLVLRNYHNRQKTRSSDPKVMKPGTIPYGYAYLEGKLVKDPKEYKTVLKIQKLWRSGKSCSAIAKELNNQKIPTRMGGRWGKAVIARILKRHEEEQSWESNHSYKSL